jgi:hypothetical protein
MRKTTALTGCLLLVAVAQSAVAQTLPASGPGSSPFDTRATVDYNQSSYSVRSTPSIGAPALTTTLSDTCMGSSSFGLSVTGFGASAGTTRVDQDCVRRLDAREFRAMGLTDVALALLCQSESNRRAVEATGHLCPGTTEPLAKVAVNADTSSLTDDEKYRDPIVRARLGLSVSKPAEQKDAPAVQNKQPTRPTTPIPAAPAVPTMAGTSTTPAPAQPVAAAVENASPNTAAPRVEKVADAPRSEPKPAAESKTASPNDADSVEKRIRMYGWNDMPKSSKKTPGVQGLVAASR